MSMETDDDDIKYDVEVTKSTSKPGHPGKNMGKIDNRNVGSPYDGTKNKVEREKDIQKQKLETEEDIPQAASVFQRDETTLTKSLKALTFTKQAPMNHNSKGGSHYFRQSSVPLFKLQFFDVIKRLDDLVGWCDLAGNTVAHHLAFAGLDRSLQAVYCARKSLRWTENKALETPMMISDGLVAPEHGLEQFQAQRALHRAIVKGALLKTMETFSRLISTPKNDAIVQHSSKLIHMAMRCRADYTTPSGPLSCIVECLQTHGKAAQVEILKSQLAIQFRKYKNTTKLTFENFKTGTNLGR